MAGLPVISGAVQVTFSTEVGELEARVTDGAAGAAGGSLSSVMVIVTVVSASTIWLSSGAPMTLSPSLASTTTV